MVAIGSPSATPELYSLYRMHTLREGKAYGMGALLDPLKHKAFSLKAVPQSSDKSYIMLIELH